MGLGYVGGYIGIMEEKMATTRRFGFKGVGGFVGFRCCYCNFSFGLRVYRLEGLANSERPQRPEPVNKSSILHTVSRPEISSKP